LLLLLLLPLALLHCRLAATTLLATLPSAFL